MEGYVDAAINEWESRRKMALALLSALPVTDDRREFTIEANPEDVTSEWVGFIREHTGINRVSMGIQSFSDTELRLISRRHSAADAIRAYKMLRAEGIGNISCDRI